MIFGMNFTFLQKYWFYYVNGAKVTLQLAFWTLIFATILGVFIGMIRVQNYRIISSLIVKAFLCIFMISAGRKTQSPALLSFGEDAVPDMLLSLGPLVSAYVYLHFHLYLELWISSIICIFVVRAAALTLLQTADALVGRRSDRKFLHELKRTVLTVDGVEGVHDIAVHNYGKMQEFGSVYISVSGSLSARRVDEISRVSRSTA